ncbi:hypothetical protein INR49_015854 [Caranx melampygus]|nr:hypothetical protein INR49_015854 [Caranx melampygus]
MGTLQCDATAVPTPEFEWYRDEKRLSNTQGINIQILGSTTILMIANVTEEDYGNYTCVASNRLGVQNASLFLYTLMQQLVSLYSLYLTRTRDRPRHQRRCLCISITVAPADLLRLPSPQVLIPLRPHPPRPPRPPPPLLSPYSLPLSVCLFVRPSLSFLAFLPPPPPPPPLPLPPPLRLTDILIATLLPPLPPFQTVCIMI